MTDIRIKMHDGTIKDFRHTPRAGGSWDKKIRYEPGFVVITDEWQNDTAIPTELIIEIQVDRNR